ncbi:MAG: thiamine phosphate synthase [Actinomycetota bacterium]
MTGDERRARLARAYLYCCTGIRDGGVELERFLDAICGGGVDVIQMREKTADARAQLRAARMFRRVADRHDVLFIVNDRADLAAACGSDGVHVGQEDLPPADARALLGVDALIGYSTHSQEQLEEASTEPVDYLGVGPVHPTPTKEGRPGVGLPYVRLAADHARVPFFVTGGMDSTTIPGVVRAGATRVVVVRALTEAADPGDVAMRLRALLPADR